MEKTKRKPFIIVVLIAIVAAIAYFMLRGSGKPGPNAEEAKGAPSATDATAIV